jgi:hypothetical protein
VDRPVKLTLDEAELIEEIARYAMKRLGQPDLPWIPPPDGRLRTVIEMVRYNSSPYALWPIRRSISREDLEFLAPYIEEWINGQAPPQNLPAEYWDWRPEALSAFKKRMQQERLWPSPASPDTGASTATSGTAFE